MNGEQNNISPGEKGGLAGPVVAVIIILAIVVLGGFYFWSQRAGDDALESINTQSELDDAASIEADLNATDVDNLDSEINAS